jgi:hypothetical protein
MDKEAQEPVGEADKAEQQEPQRKKYVPLPHQDGASLEPDEEAMMGELLSGRIRIERTG